MPNPHALVQSRDVSYVHGLRYRAQTWRTLAASGLGLAAILGLILASVPVGIAVDRLLGVTPFDPARPAFTIGFWVAGNLLLALLIPIAMLLQWLVYRGRPGTLSSLAGRFRWRVLGRAALLVVPVWLVYALAVQPALGTGAPDPTVSNLVLVVVAVVTIPLQSAGEEYLFRGLLFRAVGARFARPFVASGVATAITALGFGLIHGAGDVWAVGYYIATGIGFAVLAQRAGGLEVPVLLHATNNTLLLVPVLLAGQLASVSSPAGPILLLPISLLAVTTLLLWRVTPWLTRPTPTGDTVRQG